MSQLLAARAQMGTSLVFHIVFSILGVGLPLIICIAEGIGLWRKDATWLVLSRQWTRAFAILFVIGAVSGAIVEFEISLLWPTFVQYSGAIVGLPFACEGFAFFTEGIFLGLYVFGATRLSPFVHWLCSFPLWIAGSASAWFITSANSWMNSPAGFQIVHGKIVNVDPFAAMLNPSTPYETTHMILACYVSTGFVIAAVYAVGMLRGKLDDYHRKGLLLGMAIGAIAIPLQIVSGDLNARFLETAQPTKYAAMEGVLQSGSGKPLYIGGIVDQKTGQVYYAIEIPHGESLLAHFDLNSYTKGLDSFPANDQPNAAIDHLAFDGMVGCAFFVFFLGIAFWFLYARRKRHVPENKILLWATVIGGPLAVLAVELGWITTEEGRQPWIVYNLVRVSQAVNPAQWMNVSFSIFSLIYVLLGTTLILLLLRLARQPRPKAQLSEVIESEQGQVQDEEKQEATTS